MAKIQSAAKVMLWGHEVGYVAWDDKRGMGVFQYSDDFVKSDLDIAPIHMPLSRGSKTRYTFPGLNEKTFRRLPGLLSDSLPDKFGNRLINTWLAQQGKPASSFNPVNRLCYMGARAMGALEFEPPVRDHLEESVPVDVQKLLDIANQVTSERKNLSVNLGDNDALTDILRVGTSAGGARAKAVIAINKDTGHIVSGQCTVPDGYTHALLKFDGANDLELGKTQEFGRIEYAYYLMALDAGIKMMESDLLEEGGRAHFITERFDRSGNSKLHMQTLCGLAHYDFNAAGQYSYEQAFSTMRALRLPMIAQAQLFRRMVFNVLARNQDDHCKNISFLMDPRGEWRLSPAYDMTYAHNPAGEWTNQHQMSLNGKRDEFTLEDLVAVGENIGLRETYEHIEEVAMAVRQWQDFAVEAGVSQATADKIEGQFRTEAMPSKRTGATPGL